jgi:hypothetical protein
MTNHPCLRMRYHIDGTSMDCGKGRRVWRRRQRGVALDYGKGRWVDGMVLDCADRTESNKIGLNRNFGLLIPVRSVSDFK